MADNLTQSDLMLFDKSASGGSPFPQNNTEREENEKVKNS
jgi:hypothetical protein